MQTRTEESPLEIGELDKGDSRLRQLTRKYKNGFFSRRIPAEKHSTRYEAVTAKLQSFPTKIVMGIILIVLVVFVIFKSLLGGVQERFD